MTVMQKQGPQPDRPPDRRGHREPRPRARRDPRAGDLDSRGERDAAYIRKRHRPSASSELGSRAVLLFSLFPPAWLSAPRALSVAKILENMEIGHNVMHGQWDWMRDKKIHSTTWEWDNASPGRAVEALAQRDAPHLHQRDRQGQRPRLRHHARRRGPALDALLPRSAAVELPQRLLLRVRHRRLRPRDRQVPQGPTTRTRVPGPRPRGAVARSAARSPRTTCSTRCCPGPRSSPR